MFTRSHSCSLVVNRVHSWSFVFTRGHSCSLVWCFRLDPSSMLKCIVIENRKGNESIDLSQKLPTVFIFSYYLWLWLKHWMHFLQGKFIFSLLRKRNVNYGLQISSYGSLLTTQGGGGTPILDLTECADQHVSFYGKNYATGCPFLLKFMRKLIRKLCNWVSCRRTSFRVLVKRWISVKCLCHRVYFWAIFMPQGTGCREIFHTPPSRR